MAAISAFEALRNDGGPLPPEIFLDEPGGNHPVPTSVEYRDSRGVERLFTQTLDDQQRLVAVHLGGAVKPYMTRTWHGAGYTDNYSDGREDTVLPELNGRFAVRKADGPSAEVWADVDQSGTGYTFLHAVNLSGSGPYAPTTYLAKVDNAGRIWHETETPTMPPDDFILELSPIAFCEWTYDENNVLTSITRYRCRSYPNGSRWANYTEQFTRTDGKLHIVGTYLDSMPPGVVGRKQVRTYDDQHRVVHIADRVEVPSSAMRIAEMSMTYA